MVLPISPSSMIRFFNPGKTYLRLKDEILPEIDRVLSSGDLILRKDLEIFEEEFAQYVGTKYVVGVASGTDALFLSLKVLEIGKGDEVIVPSYTFRATIEAIHNVGAMPILIDLGEDWRPYKTIFTKAIIPAHIAGETLNWKPDDDVFMIEDACQAVGVKPVDGIMAAYSFYPAKLLGCLGDGGAIATNDERIYEELKIMRNHYKGDWKKVGFNSRLDNVQAAILRIKLRHLPKDVQRRKEIALQYDEKLYHVIKPTPREVYQDYIITCVSEDERDSLHDYLNNYEIETMKNGYPFPSFYPKGMMTIAFESKSLRIPCHQELTNDDVLEVIHRINEFYAK